MTGTNKKTIIGYKAFTHDFTSDGFQYEVGKTYECDNQNGFRFYEEPMEVLEANPLIDRNGKIIRFAEVSSSEENIIDKTIFGITVTKITIEKELSLEELIQKQVEYTLSFPNPNTSDSKDKPETVKDYSHLASSEKDLDLASSGYYSHLASSGYYSQLASSGYYSQLASSEYYSQLASSGDWSQLATSGDWSQLTSSGYYSRLASSGCDTQLASSGDCSQLASSGYCSHLIALGNNNRIVACGDNSSCDSQGEKGIIMIAGLNEKFRAAKGTHVCVATFDEDKNPTGFIVGCVGENGLKPDTLYTVRDGKFVECKA